MCKEGGEKKDGHKEGEQDRAWLSTLTAESHISKSPKLTAGFVRDFAGRPNVLTAGV